MNRKDKIELLKLIQEGKFNPEWLNVQRFIEQPDGSITLNGKPFEFVIKDEPTDPIIEKYINYDWSGVSFEAWIKLRDKYKEKKNE